MAFGTPPAPIHWLEASRRTERLHRRPRSHALCAEAPSSVSAQQPGDAASWWLSRPRVRRRVRLLFLQAFCRRTPLLRRQVGRLPFGKRPVESLTLAIPSGG